MEIRQCEEFGESLLHPAAVEAATEMQKQSLAELRKSQKFALYEMIDHSNRENYFKISCRPITENAENDMELISDIVTWGEEYLHHWEEGVYRCSRCLRSVYSSGAKWVGPCVWPSFRAPITNDAISTTQLSVYKSYDVVVKEVYCGGCSLFLGHQFEDGKRKGDRHPDARWRH